MFLKTYHLATIVVVTILLLTVASSRAQTESVLYNFTCQVDGCNPGYPLVLDKKGNLYGTTLVGGSSGLGSVFELTPSGTLSNLYSFTGGADGEQPISGLTLDSKGNLYGETFFAIFEVTPSGVETVLFNFISRADGRVPFGGLVFDKKGNLFGTANFGGNYEAGTVFEFNPVTSVFSVLYSFSAPPDGTFPAGVVLDKGGNLYGPTSNGGTANQGIIFKVTPSGSETILHNFTPNGTDGFYPNADLAIDAKGNLYGTTTWGGAFGMGAVFKVTPSGQESILHSFSGDPDGMFPYASVVLYKNKLYGTTGGGGAFGLGSVYELTLTGSETILHSFQENGIDGYQPYASVVFDKAGNLYGTTYNGGNSTNCQPRQGCGTVFKIAPAALREATSN